MVVGRRAKRAARKEAPSKPTPKTLALTASNGTNADDSDEDEPEGFEQFPLLWKGVNFSVNVEGGRFYGSWRMTKFQRGNEQVPGYAIDIWCEYKDQHYTVESIPYYGKDPRSTMKSLNADICAAVSKFLYRHLGGNLASVDDLRKQAAHPIIHVSKVETIDRIILKLREFRDTALRSGGRRLCSLKGDVEADPELAISIDVTRAAMLLEGKAPPPLSDGGILDTARRGERSGPVVNVPDKGNVASLVNRLQATTDKSEARKIRGILRRMGHRGGARTTKTA